MRKILQNKFINYSLIIVLLLLIILVRQQENNLFYDPFLQYFKSVFQNKSYPNFNSTLLIFNYFLRYFINSSLSLAIIYLLFKDFKTTKLLLYLYIVLFVLLIFTLFILLYFKNPDYNFILFYVRRFIIQPVFLILFIPAIYFQKLNFQKKME
jgi:exosortase F-associated protein